MAEFDLVIRGGTVVTGTDIMRCDVGIRAGRIADLLVLPGGVDTHCHLAQPWPEGGRDEESFISGSIASFAGGTTSAICFSSQFKGHPIRDTLTDYQARA
jgi:dihydropyrimidinase